MKHTLKLLLAVLRLALLKGFIPWGDETDGK
jgi:hypothetical protein